MWESTLLIAIARFAEDGGICINEHQVVKVVWRLPDSSKVTEVRAVIQGTIIEELRHELTVIRTQHNVCLLDCFAPLVREQINTSSKSMGSLFIEMPFWLFVVDVADALQTFFHVFDNLLIGISHISSVGKNS